MGRRKGPPEGEQPHTDTAPQKLLQGQGFLLLRLAWNTGQTGTRPAGQMHAWLPSFFPVWALCAAGKVMGRKGTELGFQFPVETLASQFL